uniref:Uncharacterized protein n=1 Tax=Sphaerodactylus townsendi TaxID=933632 RepID=A0ACB8FW05_9SAUR
MAGVDSLHGEQERSFTERVQAILVTGRLSISPHILELLALPTLEDLEADYRACLRSGFVQPSHCIEWRLD